MLESHASLKKGKCIKFNITKNWHALFEILTGDIPILVKKFYPFFNIVNVQCRVWNDFDTNDLTT